MLELIGGRKMAIALLVVMLSLGAVIMRGDVPPGFADMLKYILALFIGGNVVADVAGAVATRPPAPVDTVKDETAAQILAGVNTCQQALAAIVARMNGPTA